MKKYIINDPFPTWYYTPCMINWKKTERNKIEDKAYLTNTINASILTDLTSYVEGIVSEMILEIIWVRDFKDEKNKQYLDNITRYLDEKVLKSSWRETVSLLEMITNKKSSDLINGDILKAISYLFTFRNLLTHGVEIDINYFEANGNIVVEGQDKYDSVLKYLLEKNLLNTSFAPNINTINILSDATIDHFTTMTFKYIEQLFQMVGEFELDGLKTNFEESIQMT
ncbi:hypothetical protein WG954_18215 [Lacibacter sp. H375]|uniref:hypothetical protein n=1 Tax=Lacibacter sp. H375 TaxID=3133424 RepID=UPI0030C3BAF8